MAAILTRSVNLTGDGEPERVEAYCVTANFFPLLGIRPALGRVFTANEDVPGANKVALISYGLWQSRMADFAAFGLAAGGPSGQRWRGCLLTGGDQADR
jgi:MacB-like periplasmic core domain